MIGIYIIPLDFEGVSSNLLFSIDKPTVLLDFGNYFKESWWDNPRHGSEAVLQMYSEEFKSLNCLGSSLVIIEKDQYAMFTLVNQMKIETMVRDYDEKYFYYKSFSILKKGDMLIESDLCRIRFEID